MQQQKLGPWANRDENLRVSDKLACAVTMTVVVLGAAYIAYHWIFG